MTLRLAFVGTLGESLRELACHFHDASYRVASSDITLLTVSGVNHVQTLVPSLAVVPCLIAARLPSRHGIADFGATGRDAVQRNRRNSKRCGGYFFRQPEST